MDLKLYCDKVHACARVCLKLSRVYRAQESNITKYFKTQTKSIYNTIHSIYNI